MEKRTNETKVIVFTNNKGGVGKTSSCTSIGSLLSLLGYKCLVVDNDFQANTTATFLEDEDEAEKQRKTICDLYQLQTYSKDTVSECITATPYANLDLIPSSPELKNMDVYLYSQMGKRVVQKILAKALKVVKADYDYVLIDTHPDANLVAQNALCCSDYVLTPVQASGYSVQGLVPLVNDILAISQDEDLNPNLKFLGMFLVNVNIGTRNYKQYKDFCQETFKDDYIPIAVRNDASIEAVSTWLIPLPYLLGSRDYKASSRWKGIYDYIEFMHDVNMIDDVDYLIGMATFYTLEGRLQVAYKNHEIVQFRVDPKLIDTQNETEDLTPDEKEQDIDQEEVQEMSDYSNSTYLTLAQIVETLNVNDGLRNEVKDLLPKVAYETRVLRRYVMNSTAKSERRSYIRISSLKEEAK